MMVPKNLSVLTVQEFDLGRALKGGQIFHTMPLPSATGRALQVQKAKSLPNP